MKISSRIPSIGIQAAAENEVPIQPNKLSVKDKFEIPASLTRDQIESRVDKFEGPDSILNNFDFDLPPIPDVVQDIANNRQSLASQVGVSVNLSSLRGGGKIESRVEKYKGPDTVLLRQEIESRVGEYKGPDSLKPQDRGSRVEQYNGPKSILEEPKIESRVNKYKGPDSVLTNNFDLPPIPDAAADIINNRDSFAPRIGGLNGSLDRKEGSTDSQTSPIASRVEKYKGPKTVLESDQSSSSNQSTGKRAQR